jgi:hypothetical protein
LFLWPSALQLKGPALVGVKYQLVHPNQPQKKGGWAALKRESFNMGARSGAKWGLPMRVAQLS